MAAVAKAKELRLKNERANKTIAAQNGFGYISDVPRNIAKWSSNYELSDNSTFEMIGDHISKRIISKIENVTKDLYEKTIPEDDYQFGLNVSNISTSNSSDCVQCPVDSSRENHLFNFNLADIITGIISLIIFCHLVYKGKN